MRRMATELSVYSRALAFSGAYDEKPVLGNAALVSMAANESSMIYLLCRWADVTDVGYKPAGMKKNGDAFKLPSAKQVYFALKWMR